ncbi:unnamed protein product, partial [Urochloa humidicola]
SPPSAAPSSTTRRHSLHQTLGQRRATPPLPSQARRLHLPSLPSTPLPPLHSPLRSPLTGDVRSNGGGRCCGGAAGLARDDGMDIGGRICITTEIQTMVLDTKTKLDKGREFIPSFEWPDTIFLNSFLHI